MDVARRIYLYVASLISLVLVAAGVMSLLSQMLTLVTIPGGPERVVHTGSSTVSLAVALVIIAAPLWFLHWRFAQRLQHEPAEGVQAERQSAIRAVYLAAVVLVALLVAMVAWAQVAHGLLANLAGGRGVPPAQAADIFSLALVSTFIWRMHARVREADLRRAPLRHAAAWLPRLVRYLGAGIALGVAVNAASAILATAADLAQRSPVIQDASVGLAQPLTQHLPELIVGLAVWTILWREADRLIGAGDRLAHRDRDQVPQDERATSLRVAYFAIVLIVACATVVVCLGGVLIAIQMTSRGIDQTRDIVELVLTALPPVVVAGLHQRRAMVDAAALGPEARDALARRSLLLVSLAGLAALWMGAIGLVSVVLESMADPGTPVFRGAGGSDMWRRAEAPIAAALAGLALWLPAWRAVLGRRRRAPSDEAAAGSMAGYHFAVITPGVVVSIATAAFLLYRLLDSLIGDAPGLRISAEDAPVVAMFSVSIIVAAYQGWLARHDRRMARREEGLALITAQRASSSEPLTAQGEETAGGPMVAAGVVVDSPPPGEGPVKLALILRLAIDTDPMLALARLQVALPAGATLELAPARAARPARTRPERSGALAEDQARARP